MKSGTAFEAPARKQRPGIWRNLHQAILLVSMCVLSGTSDGGSFPDRVASFQPGQNAGFGQAYFPGNVLGPPNGNTNSQQPNQMEQDLLTLGIGGSIVLEFSSTTIVDQPGADITVFENPFQPVGSTDQVFPETAIVAVSEDGTSWTTFPFNFRDPGTTAGLLARASYEGFAGVNPVFSSPSNGISPFDPAVSGGDQFDLALIGVASARFVRITDTGTTEISPTIDADGDVVNDYGNVLPAAPTAGFDLDAVAAIHSVPVTAARREWALYE